MNIRQRRWLKLMKDYDCDISYHPGKTNVVADVLNRKSSSSLTALCQLKKSLQKDFCKSGKKLITRSLSTMTLESTLLEMIKQCQKRRVDWA